MSMCLAPEQFEGKGYKEAPCSLPSIPTLGHNPVHNLTFICIWHTKSHHMWTVFSLINCPWSLSISEGKTAKYTAFWAPSSGVLGAFRPTKSVFSHLGQSELRILSNFFFSFIVLESWTILQFQFQTYCRHYVVSPPSHVLHSWYLPQMFSISFTSCFLVIVSLWNFCCWSWLQLANAQTPMTFDMFTPLVITGKIPYFNYWQNTV